MPATRAILKLFCIIIISQSCRLSYSQTDFVYLLKNSNGSTSTGFRLESGPKGIITCLHGVVNAYGDNTIVAVNGKEKFPGLKLTKIDIAHDLALLSSPHIDRLSHSGLKSLANVDWDNLLRVDVVGYPSPLEFEDIRKTFIFPNKFKLRPLSNVVDERLSTRLFERMSPNPANKILVLDGNLRPGHSGAPVVDQDDRVLAVAGGGISWLNHGWATLLSDANFVDFDERDSSQVSKLQGLSRLFDSRLFALGTNGSETEAELNKPLLSHIIVKDKNKILLTGIDDLNDYLTQYNISLDSNKRPIISPALEKDKDANRYKLRICNQGGGADGPGRKQIIALIEGISKFNINVYRIELDSLRLADNEIAAVIDACGRNLKEASLFICGGASIARSIFRHDRDVVYLGSSFDREFHDDFLFDGPKVDVKSLLVSSAYKDASLASILRKINKLEFLSLQHVAAENLVVDALNNQNHLRFLGVVHGSLNPRNGPLINSLRIKSLRLFEAIPSNENERKISGFPKVIPYLGETPPAWSGIPMDLEKYHSIKKIIEQYDRMGVLPGTR